MRKTAIRRALLALSLLLLGALNVALVQWLRKFALKSVCKAPDS